MIIRWWAGSTASRAGLLSFSIGAKHGHKVIHFFVKPEHWQLGHKRDYEDLQSFGLGPIFLICW